MIYRADPSPAFLLERLIDAAAAADCQQGSRLLQSALANLASGNVGATCDQLNACFSQVTTQSERQLTTAQVTDLIGFGIRR